MKKGLIARLLERLKWKLAGKELAQAARVEEALREARATFNAHDFREVVEVLDYVLDSRAVPHSRVKLCALRRRMYERRMIGGDWK